MPLRRFPPQRTAVVTGAGSPRGIGRALADRLAGHGWSVAVLDIDGDAAGVVAESIARDGCPAVGYQVDIASQPAVLEVARQSSRSWPRWWAWPTWRASPPQCHFWS